MPINSSCAHLNLLHQVQDAPEPLGVDGNKRIQMGHDCGHLRSRNRTKGCVGDRHKNRVLFFELSTSLAITTKRREFYVDM